MSSFLTVKEAARLTGKSPSSIRRVIYPILENDAHPDRMHIEPSVEDVLKLRMKGENFAWRLSEELLRREVPLDTGTEKGSATASPRQGASAEGELLAMLRRELDIKNQQITQQAEIIAKQMELVTGLGERLREGNLLLANLQQRLALPPARDASTSEPLKTKRSPQPEKGSNIPAKTTKPKKGFFSRIFR